MNPNLIPGEPAPADVLIDVSKLESDYFTRTPNLADKEQLVKFGTSGHRGSPFNSTFTEAHVLAVTQAICEHRRSSNITGPLFMGKDTHAISAAAQRTVLEVLAANGVETFIQRDDGFTPTPSISHAILTYNRGRKDGFADGILLTPSHNPPEDGGLKYNPPNGGPADTDVTGGVQKRANELMNAGNAGVRRLAYASALKAASTHQHDFVTPYVNTLGEAIDMEAIREAGVRIGVDPLGGASLAYWQPIKERYNLDLTIVNTKIDPRFSFMPLDHDGKIRMDCSSPFAMAGLVKLKDQFDVAFGCDPDADRHGIISPTAGLLNPNHYLAIAINYLVRNRPLWPATAVIGKTVVSSGLIDRVVARLQRQLFEVPVGFKYFTKGLYEGTLCFGGEESAGASFLRRDGSVWSTDKDGLQLGLLAAEIVARIGPLASQYAELTGALGTPFYTRIDQRCSPQDKIALKNLKRESVQAAELAGEPIKDRQVDAPGNGKPIEGLKVITQNGWFAARPSGTEDVYKLYAESFKSQAHLDAIIVEAKEIVSRALLAGKPA